MSHFIRGAFCGLACRIRELVYMGSILSQSTFDFVASIDPILWPQGSYSHAEPAVFSLVLEFDRLTLKSAIYWTPPGRPFRTRLPEERRLGRFCTTYKRRLRASNQRKSRANYVRWIALKWGKQQKGRHPSVFTFPTDMA